MENITEQAYLDLASHAKEKYEEFKTEIEFLKNENYILSKELLIQKEKIQNLKICLMCLFTFID